MVANSIQNLPAFVDSGQHSIVTAPADTGPSPRMRNLTLRGSGSTSFLPAPVVALSCNRLRTLIIARVTFPTPRLHNRNDCRNALNENLNVLEGRPRFHYRRCHLRPDSGRFYTRFAPNMRRSWSLFTC